MAYKWDIEIGAATEEVPSAKKQKRAAKKVTAYHATCKLISTQAVGKPLEFTVQECNSWVSSAKPTALPVLVPDVKGPVESTAGAAKSWTWSFEADLTPKVTGLIARVYVGKDIKNAQSTDALTAAEFKNPVPDETFEEDLAHQARKPVVEVKDDKAVVLLVRRKSTLDPADAFLTSFKSCFHEIIPAVFPQELTTAAMEKLFSKSQREALAGFFETRRIPIGLFHSNETGKEGRASVRQRILMSAVILSTGHNQKVRDGDPPENPGKPRAGFCGHWAHWVWAYAGASNAGTDYLGPSVGPSQLHVNGPCGEVFYGAGTSAERTGPNKKQRAGGYPIGFPAAKVTTPYDPAKATYESCDRSIYEDGKPWSVAPGDWIVIDNGVGHSLIFLCWTGKPDKSHPAIGSVSRKAKCFSQYHPTAGGVLGECLLGIPPNGRGGSGLPGRVSPLTGIIKPNEARAHPPRTEQELLPFEVSDEMLRLNKAALAKHRVARDKLHAKLVERAKTRLASLGDRLHKDQRALIEKIIDSNSALGDDADEAVRSITILYALLKRLYPPSWPKGRKLDGAIPGRQNEASVHEFRDLLGCDINQV